MTASQKSPVPMLRKQTKAIAGNANQSNNISFQKSLGIPNCLSQQNDGTTRFCMD